MIKKFGLSQARTVATPADVSVQLKKNDGVSKEVNSTLHQFMVGSLLYAANATRLDIAQAVGVVSKFRSKPSEAHLTAVKRILRYLKGIANISLKFEKSIEGDLIGFSDAGDQDDCHSTTGNLFRMAGGPVSWLHKKQAIVALSTSEVEYVALCVATRSCLV